MKIAEGFSLKPINVSVLLNFLVSMKSLFRTTNRYPGMEFLRGIHYQKGEFAQTKIVRVIYGKVLDVVVDLRPESPSFKKTFSTILDDQNLNQLYVPKGFGHGFLTLSEKSVFAYKCDQYYTPGSEAGIIFNDPDLNIDWNFPEREMILSEKDRVLPTFKQTFQ